MQNNKFVDYYEALQSSPNAEPNTIERLFIHFAKQYHPNVPETGNEQKFALITEAFETLRDPATRVEFDKIYAKEKTTSAKESISIDDDASDRHNLLTLFYSKRRKDMNNPGLATGGIEHLVNYSLKVLEFHLWYFVKKGWIERMEGGQLSITAEGVDKIEETEMLQQQKLDDQTKNEDAPQPLPIVATEPILAEGVAASI